MSVEQYNWKKLSLAILVQAIIDAADARLGRTGTRCSITEDDIESALQYLSRYPILIKKLNEPGLAHWITEIYKSYEEI